MLRGLIFDLDNTLVDSRLNFDAMRREMDLPAGLPILEAIERLPSAQANLSPDEQAFIADEAPGESAVAQFGWRFECLFVLEWALGLVDALPFPGPSATCRWPRA